MSVLPSCANCGAALNGPFCSNCGQRASDLHRPIWWILGEFLDAIFNYDSRTFRTLWLLFAVPGEFTRRYIVGQRASMLPPFRLFVIATVVFFVTLQLTGLAVVAFRTEVADLSQLPPEAAAAIRRGDRSGFKIVGKDRYEYVTLDFFVPASSVHPVSRDTQSGGLKVEFDKEKATATAEELDWLNWLETKAVRMQEGYQRVLADPIKLNGPLNVWLPRLMLILVPVFALLVALFHWWPRVFLIEHLIFSLHIHTVLFVAFSLTAVGAYILGDSSFFWSIWLILAVYLWMAMMQVYQRSWWLTSLKFIVIISVYSMILSAGFGVIFLLALSEV